MKKQENWKYRTQIKIAEHIKTACETRKRAQKYT